MKPIQYVLRGTLISAVFAVIAIGSMASAQDNPYAEPEEPSLPQTNMVLDLPRTAIVITDPQIDFPSPDGVTWELVGKSVTANKTVEHIEQLLKSAKANGIYLRFEITNLRALTRSVYVDHRSRMSSLSCVAGYALQMTVVPASSSAMGGFTYSVLP